MKKKPEGPKMFKLTARLTENLAERAKIRAIKEKRTLQEVVALALEAYLRGPMEGKP
jgi:hypothetical protein